MADTATVMLDLDALVGGEVRVKLDGKEEVFYADFCSADETHYTRIQARRLKHFERGRAWLEAFEAHKAAVAAAEEAGKAPPAEPEMRPFDANDPDFYLAADYDRDVFAVLTRVWQASENAKPEGERMTITGDYVRGKCNLRQAEALLRRLWLSRQEARVSVPASVQAPAETPTKVPAPRRRGKGGS